MMANSLFAFVGPYASGKSTMISQLMSMGIPCIKTYTTKIFKPKMARPDIYETMEKDEFLRQDFIVKVSYKGDYYGLLKKDVLTSLDKNKLAVTVLDANGSKQIKKLIKQNIFTIYLMADYVALVDRMLRMGLRNDEIKYHLEYAETNNEFDNWKTANHVVKNTGQLNTALEQVLSIMGLMTLPPQEEFEQLIK
jgi:guanylate kinase